MEPCLFFGGLPGGTLKRKGHFKRKSWEKHQTIQKPKTVSGYPEQQAGSPFENPGFLASETGTRGM